MSDELRRAIACLVLARAHVSLLKKAVERGADRDYISERIELVQKHLLDSDNLLQRIFTRITAKKLAEPELDLDELDRALKDTGFQG